MPQSAATPHLARGLKNRHIQLIALGGAIGAGLFLGTKDAIQLAGPSILLAYFIGSSIIYMVMRMLGEMVTQEPIAGSFSAFAHKYWGPFAGFVSGWNYWILYILVSIAELSAVGHYMQFWYPELPLWIPVLAAWVLVTAINLFQVALYGEFEFWLAIIKIVAIIAMIALGAWLLLFVPHDPLTTGLANFWQHGGFTPNGWHGLMLSMVIVMFSFGGAELIGITAAEAQDPQKSIPKAVNQVLWRILIFYIGAIAVLIMLYPWNKIGDNGSPFVTIFSDLGIPAAPHILNFVILTAALSVYNSGMYSTGRMLYNLAEQGNAPRFFMRLNAKQIPWTGTLFTSACIFLAVILNYLMPEGVFMQVMAITTAAVILTWGIIVLTHWHYRRATAGQSKHFAAPFYPWANWLCLAFLLGLLLLMSQLDKTRTGAWLAPIWLLALALGYGLKRLLSRRPA